MRLSDWDKSNAKIIQQKFGLSRSDAIRAALQRFAEELAA